jgi:RNA polymerase sigma factor (sigma-70 family)
VIDTKVFLTEIGWEKTTLSVIKHPVEQCAEENWDRLYNFARKRCWYHIQDAEDVLSESLAKALVKWDSVKPEKLLSWIFRIIQTTAIDLDRKKKKTVEITDNQGSYNWELPAWSVDQLKKILYHMSPKDRSLLVLSYLDELTHQEISDQLNIPLKLIPVQLTRAKQRGKHIALKLYGSTL